MISKENLILRMSDAVSHMQVSETKENEMFYSGMLQAFMITYGKGLWQEYCKSDEKGKKHIENYIKDGYVPDVFN